ncbi:hypothetical protein BGX28_000188 [Mortierella sp. GBA30]|nr:hypothetical protein BGX28_000188 [Mortierella sp. GBA30]
MRTAELINLLRSKERTSSEAKTQLATLDNARFLHLLGELSKWLLAEVTKYQALQYHTMRAESRPQTSVRSQIKQTFMAINALLDSTTTPTGHSTSDRRSMTARSRSPSEPRETRTVIPLDGAQKEIILEDFLTPLLIALAPLVPAIDTHDIQQMSAKILCYCTNPRSTNAPFPPEIVARKMMSLSTRRSGDNSTRPSVHAITGLIALLRSPYIKLQDYGLRILTSHRFLVDMEPTWQVIAPVMEVLESLRDNLTNAATENPPHTVEKLDAMMGSEETGPGIGAAEGGVEGAEIRRELETTLVIQSKALSLLQLFLQLAGQSTSLTLTAIPHTTSNHQPVGSIHKDRRPFLVETLRDNLHIALLVDLWRATQLITLFSRTKSMTVERLVLATTATIYWSCWVFQDEVVPYVMAVGADTMMAWYGYYIISHADAYPDSAPNLLTTAPMSSAGDAEVNREDIKHQSSVLEYVTKLIYNISKQKKYQAGLFSGKRPIGIVMIRRTIEFLDNALESSLPLSGPSSPRLSVDEDGTESNTTKIILYAVQVLQQKPGILEAMLGTLNACLGASREGDDIVLHSRLLSILVLLMSNVEHILGIEMAASTVQRIHNHTFNLLQSILRRDAVIPGIENVTADQWALGYGALVDTMMQPLEQDYISVNPPSGEHEAKEWVREGENQLKVINVFKLFWKHHPKGHSMLSELFGPRFYQFSMVHVLMGPASSNGLSESAKWIKCRTLNLVETMVYFGVEAGVRINMRERWSSLLFITMLLGASVKRLESCGYSAREKFSREVGRTCLDALKNFWYDQQSLIQLVDLALAQEDTVYWNRNMPTIAAPTDSSNSWSASIVPLLLAIVAPPGTEWSIELMLGSSDSRRRRRKQWKHMLLDREEPLLVKAAWLLSVLSQFSGCQQRLISTPGAIWTLSRQMVERLLVNLDGSLVTNDAAATQKDNAESVQTSLEKALLITLRRVMSAVDLAKALVSNNTITELFAAIMEIDRPLAFHSTKLVFEVVDAEDLQEQILPTPSQQELHVQLLAQYRSAMLPLQGQFDRVYQYVGGHRSFQDTDESAETVYWLREYCALALLYNSEPPSTKSSTSWATKVDKTALLSSESIFGVACRMLTLEMEYQLVDEDEQDSSEQRILAHDEDEYDHAKERRLEKNPDEEVMRAQKEESILRRFSAGVAIQSLCWRNVPQWRIQHQELKRSYMNVMTAEWESYVKMMKQGDADSSDAALSESPSPVEFLVQDRVITFYNRSCLARSSIFFYNLLQGEYKETSQQQIQIQDVDADDFEMLLEVVKESLLTVQHVLPEDLPFSIVLRLMACAERFMVVYVRRLAETWILNVLQTREMKYFRLVRSPGTDVQPGLAKNLRRPREESPPMEKVKRLRPDEEDWIADQTNDGNLVAVLEDDDQEVLDENASQLDNGEEDETGESIQECLLMVYEACSDPRHGDLYSPQHPFYGLVWDVIKRMVLRLGTVAMEPQFAAMLERGGEERIEDFLRIIFELAVENGFMPR